MPQQIDIPFEHSQKAWSQQTVETLLSLLTSTSVKDEVEVARLIASSLEEASLKLRTLRERMPPSRQDLKAIQTESERENVVSSDTVKDMRIRRVRA